MPTGATMPKKTPPTETEAEVVETKQLARIEPTREVNPVLMPAVPVKVAVERYKQLVAFVGELMHEGSDFGIIPGTGGDPNDPDPKKRPKPVLLQPGGEKLCMFFGLRAEFDLIDSVKDWAAGIFYFEYKCRLFRGDDPVGEGVGSANSREKKYRWRNADRVCPVCSKAAIFKSKNAADGWYCWTKRGGCGQKFHERAPEIVNQEVGQIENPEPFELINTIQKMGQKRAFMGAVIRTVNASEFFTQDLEDMDPADYGGHSGPAMQPPNTPSGANAAPPRASSTSGRGKTPPKPAQAASAPAGEAAGPTLGTALIGTHSGVVTKIAQVKAGANFHIIAITIDGHTHNAIINGANQHIEDLAFESRNKKLAVDYLLEKNRDGKFINLTEMRLARPAGENGVPYEQSENNPANYQGDPRHPVMPESGEDF